MARHTVQNGSMRMGPATLLVFMVTLCLAVMVMLALATSKANSAYTDRQADFTADVYQNESTAQAFLSEVDSALSTGGVSQLQSSLSSMSMQAQAAGESQVSATLSNGNVLSATFEASSGRQLVVQLHVSNNGYTVDKWSTNTDWEQDNSEKLWQG